MHHLTLSYFSDGRNEERGPVVIDKRQDDHDDKRPDNNNNNLRPDTSDLSTRILHFSYIGLAILGESLYPIQGGHDLP